MRYHTLSTFHCIECEKTVTSEVFSCEECSFFYYVDDKQLDTADKSHNDPNVAAICKDCYFEVHHKCCCLNEYCYPVECRGSPPVTLSTTH